MTSKDRIVELDVQIERSRFYAYYHLMEAHTLVASGRKRYKHTGVECPGRGCAGAGECDICWRPFTEQEMRQDALNTAESHFHTLEECIRNRHAILSKGEGMSNFVEKARCLMCCAKPNDGVGFCSNKCKSNWFEWPKSKQK